MTDPDGPSHGTLLGVDLGHARTGLAVAAAGLAVATPLRVVHAPLRRVEKDILAACEERGAEGVVLGVPAHMDGREGALAPRARRLAGRIAKLMRIPVWLWDETLSTWEVERGARAAGATASGRDDLAAVVILQGFLDAKGWTRDPEARPVAGEER